MKKAFKKVKHKLKDYWRHMMGHSDEIKMSQGAREVEKNITWARGDNWRRKEKKK